MEEEKKSIKEYPTHEINPFEIQGIIEKKNNYGGKEKRMVDEDGVIHKFREMSTDSYFKDEKKYKKIYEEAFVTIKDLSTPALRIFCYVSIKLNIHKDEVFIDMTSCNEFCGYDSRQPFYKGIVELLEKKFIAKKVGRDHNYFINTNLLFNGDRTKIKGN